MRKGTSCELLMKEEPTVELRERKATQPGRKGRTKRAKLAWVLSRSLDSSIRCCLQKSLVVYDQVSDS